jgi:tungstate transport system ATP-binding protein
MLYKIDSLKKIHGTTTILDISGLAIERGTIYSLTGPNGAGKTTLLNLLSFLDVPTSGTIHFQGTPVVFQQRMLHQLRRQVVQVDQYPILFTGTVGKNVAYGLKIRGVEKKQRTAVVEEVLEMVGMSSFVNADALTLSGGETKRVALARALAIEPDVLLCDEPTANVDTENQAIILDILKKCNRDKNVSLIFATHSLSEAATLADNTIVLQNGRLSHGRKINVYSLRHQRDAGRGDFWVIGETLMYPVAELREVGAGRNKVYIAPDTISCTLLHNREEQQPDTWPGWIRRVECNKGKVELTVDCGLDLTVLMDVAEYRRQALNVDSRVAVHAGLEPSMFFTG